MKTANEHSSPSRILAPEGRALFKWIAIASSLIAAGLHAYLLKNHYDLRFGEVSGELMCDISSKFSCSAASASKWSEVFGIPLALLGLLSNLAFITLAAWDPIADQSGKNSNRTGILTVAGIMLIASIVMGIISVTSLDTICPFCAGTYLMSIITFLTAWLAYRPGTKFELKPATIGVAIAFAISAFILNDQIKSGYTGGTSGDQMAAAALQEWTQNPKLEIPETDPLARGPARAEAKMVVAEFADFRCIHCRLASAPIKAFAASHPDVRLEYYSWPLDGECNTSITQNNGASCLLARIVWCARKKADKGWEAHEKVFARLEEWKTSDYVRGALDSLAKEIGIPFEDLKTCSDSVEAKAAISSQARLGTGLNIRGTPSIYVNGKLLPAGSSLTVLNAVHGSLR